MAHWQSMSMLRLALPFTVTPVFGSLVRDGNNDAMCALHETADLNAKWLVGMIL